MFMQTLISISYKNLLEKKIWDALIENNKFFRDICSTRIHIQHMKQLEKNMIEIICKLEMIFPPFFFYSMEHLSIHLVYEIKVRGPI